MIDYDKRLYVYFNLHKRTWSIRQSGKIIGHHGLIFLKDCRFLVSKAGQARVRREGKKNVHAGVSGYLAMNVGFPHHEKHISVKYNPYKNDTFVQDDGQAVTESEWVRMQVLDGKPRVQAVNLCGVST